MAKSATTVSEVREKELTDCVGTGVVGICVLLAALLIYYFLGLSRADPSLRMGRILAGLGALAGATILVAAISRGLRTRKLTGISVPCPYCDATNLFLADPTANYDCEHCHRTVHFVNGIQVPIRTIACSSCGTQHRVAANAQRYVCDQCNHQIDLTHEAPQRSQTSGASGPGVSVPEPNYDVLLLAAERPDDDHLLFKLENLMVINMNEVRHALATVTSANPLIVCYDLPYVKADSIQRQLEDLGATVVVRPTTCYTPDRDTDTNKASGNRHLASKLGQQD